MKVFDDGTTLTFRFSVVSSLVINREAEMLLFGKERISFSEVKGFWKNYRFAGKKKVYYVVILTKNKMTRITPEMDEYDVDQVISSLKEILGDDKYAR